MIEGWAFEFRSATAGHFLLHSASRGLFGGGQWY